MKYLLLFYSSIIFHSCDRDGATGYLDYKINRHTKRSHTNTYLLTQTLAHMQIGVKIIADG
jgi:hypothetical protein